MTTKADTSVKWFSSDLMVELPTLNGVKGSLISILDALLVSGVCVRTPDNISISNEVCTISFSAGNPYPAHSVIKVEATSVSNLNDEWRVATSTANSITFVTPGIANGNINTTGVSVKLAPLGWEKLYSGVNRAVYRSKDLSGIRPCLMVDDDTNANTSICRGYENMTDLTTGSNPFPSPAAAANPIWPRSNESNANARHYAFNGSSKYFNYLPRFASTYPDNFDLYSFGEFTKFNPNDTFAAFINTAAGTVNPGWSYCGTNRHGASYSSGYNFSLATPNATEYSPNTYALIAGHSQGPGENDPPLNGFDVHAKATIMSGNSYAYRGELPGVALGVYRKSGWFTTPQTVTLEDGTPALLLNASEARRSSNTPQYAKTLLLDMYGPWD